jgi:23S rRNA pseudouridine2605 synthase
MEKRLQKILSEMGVASRRKAEEMIAEGRVTVNGRPAELGMKADPGRDHIKVDGRLLVHGPEPKVYMMFHKPRNVLSTMGDGSGRVTVKDYLKKVRFRVFPVGRLDYDSEGLLLITNDGEFSNAVIHPRGKIPKVYEVLISGVLEDDEIERLRTGVRLEDGMTAPAKVRKMRKLKSKSWIEITLYEGKKRQIRRMMRALGHHVNRLRRTRVGTLSLGGLKQGELRHVTADELDSMIQKTGMHKEAS